MLKITCRKALQDWNRFSIEDIEAIKQEQNSIKTIYHKE